MRSDATRFRFRLAFCIAIVTYGLGAALPAAPAEGFALVIVELRHRNIAARTTGLLLSAAQWIQFWTLIIAFACDRVIASILGNFRAHHRGRGVIVAVMVMFVATGVIAVLRRPKTARRVALVLRVVPGARRQSREALIERSVRWHRDLLEVIGSRRSVRVPVLFAGVAWLCDVGALACALRCIGASAAFTVVVIAYVVGVAATWLPFLPGGVGLVELAIPAVLHRVDIPTQKGLGAVLIWRAISLALPAIAGSITYLALRVVRRRATA